MLHLSLTRSIISLIGQNVLRVAIACSKISLYFFSPLICLTTALVTSLEFLKVTISLKKTKK